jgi:DNA gyrase subunit A
VKGPDFPTGAYIVGRAGIEAAYRTGRGSIIMRGSLRTSRRTTAAAPVW